MAEAAGDEWKGPLTGRTGTLRRLSIVEQYNYLNFYEVPGPVFPRVSPGRTLSEPGRGHPGSPRGSLETRATLGEPGRGHPGSPRGSLVTRARGLGRPWARPKAQVDFQEGDLNPGSTLGPTGV